MVSGVKWTPSTTVSVVERVTAGSGLPDRGVIAWADQEREAVRGGGGYPGFKGHGGEAMDEGDFSDVRDLHSGIIAGRRGASGLV